MSAARQRYDRSLREHGRRVVDFCEYCGGMGNLLMIEHAGFLSHENTVDNLTPFAREVLPRLDPAAAILPAGEPPSSRDRPGDLVDATMVTSYSPSCP